MNRERMPAWLLFLWVTTALALPHAAAAQSWMPQRHVELLSPGGAGGALDTTARTVERLWQELKLVPVSSAVVVRAGGEHAVAYNYIHQRKGDPHFLSLASPVLLSNHLSGVQPITYADVTPIASLISEYYVFVVRTESALRSGKDFVEALRRRPDSASIAVGTLLTRMAAGVVLQAGNVDIKQAKIVTFAGAAKQALAVVGGHVDVGVAPFVLVAPHVEAGSLRVIAVSGPRRMSGALTAVPTWAELGYADATSQTWRSVIAPKDITAAQIVYWEGVLRRVTESEEFRRIAEKNQWEVAFRDSAQTRKFMEADYAQMKRVMTYLGVVK
jgi:putative tricarboxylic transport membrane protein